MDTIDISVKAVEYAGGKAVDCLTKAIEQAYKDGYLNGFEDGREEARNCISTGEVRYVDLGLPSGTLWSDDYVKKDGKIMYWAYGDACSKSIPTEEQWNELQENCTWRYTRENNSLVAKCIGPNGQMIRFWRSGKLEGDVHVHKNAYFWVLSTRVLQKNLRIGARIRFLEDEKGSHEGEFCFVGIGLPIRLVKNRD